MKAIAEGPEDVENAKFYKSILAELESGVERPSTVVNHPVNDGKPDAIPAIKYNPQAPEVSTNCDNENTNEITCDLYYELDWSFYFTSKSTCFMLEKAKLDPCFGTFACLCDNGYFRVSENMPDPNVEQAEVLIETEWEPVIAEPVEEEEEEEVPVIEEPSGIITTVTVKEKSEDDDDNTATIALIVIGVVLFTVVLVFASCAIYSCRKAANVRAPKSMNSANVDIE